MVKYILHNTTQLHTFAAHSKKRLRKINDLKGHKKSSNKSNTRLRFLYRKSRFLSQPLHRLLCNATIQPHFDYASWYLNLNKNL